ncbi:MAG: nucleoside:proton symporter [Hyphomicrobiales bacterium]|nr:nucleoside:proton symporter [Hyphomicrobiales bacterium]
MLMVQSLIGVVLIPLIAWCLSEDRASLRGIAALKVTAAGLACQAAIAALLLGIPASRVVFELLARAVTALQAATLEGVRLVFGYLGGGPAPFEMTDPQAGFILAFQALPLILVMAVLSRLAYHWGVLQRVVAGFAWALQKSLRVGGPLGTATAANIFVGMVDAPLLIRPYLGTMTRGALFATMTAGMATVAGTVLALYASLLAETLPTAAGHLIAASVMSAPAALMIARLMVPQGFVEGPEQARVEIADPPKSSMDAVAQGTVDGVRILAYVIAMLIVMVALVALANMILGAVATSLGFDLTVQKMLGWAFAPLAWSIGIPWSEAGAAGGLLGIKTVLNELLAYIEMAKLGAEALSPRSRLIMTYALCGFANLGSLGIMIAGLVAMAPERRIEIVALGPKTIVSGTLATLLTGAIVGAMTLG